MSRRWPKVNWSVLDANKGKVCWGFSMSNLQLTLAEFFSIFSVCLFINFSDFSYLNGMHAHQCPSWSESTVIWCWSRPWYHDAYQLMKTSAIPKPTVLMKTWSSPATCHSITKLRSHREAIRRDSIDWDLVGHCGLHCIFSMLYFDEIRFNITSPSDMYSVGKQNFERFPPPEINHPMPQYSYSAHSYPQVMHDAYSVLGVIHLVPCFQAHTSEGILETGTHLTETCLTRCDCLPLH